MQMKIFELRRVAAFAAATAITVMGVPLTAHADASVTKSYVAAPASDVVGQQADALIRCTGDNPQDNAAVPNPGGTCFIAVSGEKVSVSIKDAADPKAGGVLVWLDGAFAETSDPEMVVCGSADGIVVPASASYIEVLVGVVNHDNKVPPAVACGVPAPGSTGTVTASGKGVLPTGGGAPAPASRPATAAAGAATSAAPARTAGVTTVAPVRRVARGPVLL
jgi:hypothetical protein